MDTYFHSESQRTTKLCLHTRDLGIPRNQPEERTGLLIYRRSGFGQHGEWKDTEENNYHTPIHQPIQQRPQIRGLDRHGSSTSAPTTLQRPVPVEDGTKEVQPGFTMGRTRGKIPEDMSQRDVFQRAYGNYQRLEYQQEIQTFERDRSQNQ
ncbi:hypothetical protein O181_020124 [Austropuccinia psidii MF-1]|uniref:Uncharacterized protein n=1 Tax=Austropuccinia psidii MF-1 TaxID=1389203 RepID=A0A9Q3CAR5_9BASI|nr:hypothetical protein [Austropuccinia psidii MF-1]